MEDATLSFLVLFTVVKKWLEIMDQGGMSIPNLCPKHLKTSSPECKRLVQNAGCFIYNEIIPRPFLFKTFIFFIHRMKSPCILWNQYESIQVLDLWKIRSKGLCHKILSSEHSFIWVYAGLVCTRPSRMQRLIPKLNAQSLSFL